MSTFAVVTPSRGLVHSRTVEAVMAAVERAEAAGHEFRGWRLTHDLPIPDCHEKVAELGLATGADALWFVEEDNVPPPTALTASFDMLDEFPVVAVDYPVADAWACINHDEQGEVRWSGLGSTLIRREVFETLPRPWFSSDWQYILRYGQWSPHPIPVDAPPDARYGLQDIHFSMQVRAAGLRIGQVPDLFGGHAKIVEWGALASNHGAHRIELRTEIRHWQ
jgi:hypothetical protein